MVVQLMGAFALIVSVLLLVARSIRSLVKHPDKGTIFEAVVVGLVLVTLALGALGVV